MEHVGVVHPRVFDGEIGRLSQLSVRRLEKLFETNPRLLYCRNMIPLANFYPGLARPVKYDVGNIGCLGLGIIYPRYVGELEDILD